jgi:hypothetical protein
MEVDLACGRTPFKTSLMEVAARTAFGLNLAFPDNRDFDE